MSKLSTSLIEAVAALESLANADLPPRSQAEAITALFQRNPKLKSVFLKHKDRVSVDVEALVRAPDAAARWTIERKQIRDMLSVCRDELADELGQQS